MTELLKQNFHLLLALAVLMFFVVMLVAYPGVAMFQHLVDGIFGAFLALLTGPSKRQTNAQITASEVAIQPEAGEAKAGAT